MPSMPFDSVVAGQSMHFGSAGLTEVAQAALAAPTAASRTPSDLLLDGLATRFTEGYAGCAPILKRAPSAYPNANISSEEALRSLWLALNAMKTGASERRTSDVRAPTRPGRSFGSGMIK
jgi:hypothetical protein